MKILTVITSFCKASAEQIYHSLVKAWTFLKEQRERSKRELFLVCYEWALKILIKSHSVPFVCDQRVEKLVMSPLHWRIYLIIIYWATFIRTIMLVLSAYYWDYSSIGDDAGNFGVVLFIMLTVFLLSSNISQWAIYTKSEDILHFTNSTVVFDHWFAESVLQRRSVCEHVRREFLLQCFMLSILLIIVLVPSLVLFFLISFSYHPVTIKFYIDLLTWDDFIGYATLFLDWYICFIGCNSVLFICTIFCRYELTSLIVLRSLRARATLKKWRSFLGLYITLERLNNFFDYICSWVCPVLLMLAMLNASTAVAAIVWTFSVFGGSAQQYILLLASFSLGMYLNVLVLTYMNRSLIILKDSTEFLRSYVQRTSVASGRAKRYVAREPIPASVNIVSRSFRRRPIVIGVGHMVKPHKGLDIKAMGIIAEVAVTLLLYERGT